MASEIGFGCLAPGASSFASRSPARPQSRVPTEWRYRLPFSSPSHQIGHLHFVYAVPFARCGHFRRCRRYRFSMGSRFLLLRCFGLPRLRACRRRLPCQRLPFGLSERAHTFLAAPAAHFPHSPSNLIFFHIYNLSAWLPPVKRERIDLTKRLVYYQPSAWLLQAEFRKGLTRCRENRKRPQPCAPPPKPAAAWHSSRRLHPQSPNPQPRSLYPGSGNLNQRKEKNMTNSRYWPQETPPRGLARIEPPMKTANTAPPNAMEPHYSLGEIAT